MQVWLYREAFQILLQFLEVYLGQAEVYLHNLVKWRLV